MNKLGIWAIAIAGAFLIGILSANPVVEAVGGWQGALEIKHFTTTEVSGFFIISDSDVTSQSVVTLSVDEVQAGTDPDSEANCIVSSVDDGSFVIDCIEDFLGIGSIINYIVFNS